MAARRGARADDPGAATRPAPAGPQVTASACAVNPRVGQSGWSQVADARIRRRQRCRRAGRRGRSRASMPRGRAAFATSTPRRSTGADFPSTASARPSRTAARRVPAVDEGRPHAAPGRPSRRRSHRRQLPFDVAYDYWLRRRDALDRGQPATVGPRAHRHRLDLHDVTPRWLGEQYERHFAEAIDAGYRALDRLRGEGVIRAVGVGVKDWEVCLRFAPRGRLRSLHARRRLHVARPADRSTLASALRAHDIAVVLASPFNSGILATGAVERATYFYEPAAVRLMVAHAKHRRRSARVTTSRWAPPRSVSADPSGDRERRRGLCHRCARSRPTSLARGAARRAVGGAQARGPDFRRAPRFRATADERGAEFDGYVRPDGSVGVRNHVLILSLTGLTGPAARRIGRIVRRALRDPTPYGSGLMGEDAAVQTRSLIGFGLPSERRRGGLVGGDKPEGRGASATALAEARASRSRASRSTIATTTR